MSVTCSNETSEWVHVTVGDETITCTPEHPFYSPVKGWTNAIDLRAGDILVMLNGEYVVIEQVQHELLESPAATYNFEVEGFHTYYVGSKSVLSHNECQVGNVKNYKVFGSKREAFRAAKRDAGIPMTEQPTKVTQSKWHDTNITIPGRTYTFGNQIVIIGHDAGHVEYGMGPHFNIRIDGIKWHYYYPLIKGD